MEAIHPDVHEALKDVSLFEFRAQVPMVFREDDSLDELLDRIPLGLYSSDVMQ